MPRTADKLIVTMMYPEMFGKTHINQSLITAPAVCIDDALDTDTTSNDLLQRCFGSIGNNLGINLVPMFQNAENDGFPICTAPTSVPDTFGTKNRLRPILQCRIKVPASRIRQPNAGAISGTGY